MQQYEMGIALEVAPTLEVSWVKEDQAGNLLTLEQPGLAEPTTDTEVFAGVRAALDLVYKDDPENPRLGYTWTTSVQLNRGVHNLPNDYVRVSSALALYLSLPMAHQVTLAVRAGGAHNEGTFPFYAANTLGGTTNLRGFRSTRFSGRSSFYTNAELRLDLFSPKGAFLPGRLGVLGFVDNGRVWTDGESSDKWHQGYGGGLRYNIVDEIVLSFTYGKSDEGTHLLGGVGFLF